MFTLYNLLRASGHLDTDTIRQYDLEGFVANWALFKQSHGAVDFGDMLDFAQREMDFCAFDPAILIVDEAQDMTPQQWSIVRKWSESPHLERFIVAGDPAQAFCAVLYLLRYAKALL